MNRVREPSPIAAGGTTSDGPPLISARGLHKSYKLGEQAVRALQDVSFDICAGEYVAIMGPSGSGKSTVMNLIGALDQPTADQPGANPTSAPPFKS